MSDPGAGVEQWGDEPASWPVRESRVLGQGRISGLVDDQLQTPSGDLIERQYLSHPGAVGVIAWDDSDRIAVVRQYRHPVGFRLAEPPAGLLDHDGEDYRAAAARELAEEAQLQAGDWRVLVDVFTSPGSTEESLRIFLATGLAPAPIPDGFVVEGEEADMDLCWVARQELVDAILAGRLQNPTMVAGVLALETARLSGRLAELRPAGSAWPAREVWQQRRERADGDQPG